MNTLCRMLSVAAVIVCVGCGGSSMFLDYDRGALWSDYRTYDWLPEPRAASIGPLAENPKHRTWIESTVDLEMKRAGLRRDTENPDLVVAYYAGIRGPLDPASWGYQYGPQSEYVQGGLDQAT